jgi:hypothetical protein
MCNACHRGYYKPTGINNKDKTHCERGGHPLEGANLLLDKHGRRKCRTCQIEHQRAYDARKRAKKAAVHLKDAPQ